PKFENISPGAELFPTAGELFHSLLQPIRACTRAADAGWKRCEAGVAAVARMDYIVRRTLGTERDMNRSLMVPVRCGACDRCRV
ncbi:MAG: hypothetical protein RRA94_11300, partial [Bacteroidota bacterium]|nr:hypothetical protein [Bacteroidota bacterium]